MAQPTYLAPGVVLQDRYEVAEEIGRGGFSIVYRARDRRVGADVAIKLLVPPPAAAHLARERLRREVQAVRQLTHPNIVTVYDVVDDGPWSFVVMEYVPGPDLAVRVRRQGPLDPESAARLGCEISAALAAAHRHGVLHRDVKPQNILLAPDGRARLTDFGSARLAGQETVTQTGGLVGTVDYAAPEQLAGGRGDARADEYALGVTLYYALTGELPPRRQRSGTDARGEGREGHHPKRRRPDVPAWLDEVVGRATRLDPDDRFPAIALLAAALERGDDGTIVTPGSSAEKARCALCRGPEPFGIGVCPRCARRAGAGGGAGGAGGAGGDDVLVFLERTTPGPARRAVHEALDERLGTVASAAGRAAAAAGERPLLRIPAEAGARVVELLEAQGLPARTESHTSPWQASVPPPILALAGVVAAAGAVAGLAAATPVLLLTSPALAAVLVTAAAALRRTPIWNPAVGARPALPPEAERAAARTLAALPAGAARGLLTDLLRRATTVTVGAGGAERFDELVIAACDAARDLAALEQHLGAFDARRDRLADAPPGWLDALSRCERGRDLLTQRLLEASAALSDWQAGAVRAGGTETLSELTRDLGEEGRRQEAAAREVAELLL
ncbi:MAG TPA: serine/threonine-protein kinase [Gemmatimonadales bacterium]|nr:serine/threonine-protein kinase [Gemmatimonadales bacterium]